jgi:hypothetical protein
MAKKQKNKKSDSVEFHYIKSPTYRSYHVDGLHGGFAPTGYLYANIFHERFPIPQIETINVENGVLGEITDKETKTGVVRLVEASLAMNYATAVSIRDWLNDRISNWDDLTTAGTTKEIKQ